MAQVTRREFLAAAAASPLARKPNLLFILADQWRGQALPWTDRDLIAPNLSRLAEGGVEFTRAYTCYPAGSPSRAAMLTGRYPHTCRVLKDGAKLPEDEATIAISMKSAGYATGYIGEWRLDGDSQPGFVPPGARRHGFDFWAAFNRGYRYEDSVYFGDTNQPIQEKRFEPDYQTALAIDFIERNQKNPFGLVVAYGPPHPPRKAPNEFANLYRPSQFKPRQNVPADHEDGAREGLAGYYALCTAVDRNIGHLLDTLERLSLVEDTIVVFTSDHGDMLGSQALDLANQFYEESVRVPLLLRFPRKLKGGEQNEALACNVDLMPTLLSLCDMDVPAGVQGRDLASKPESIYSYGQLGSDAEWRMVIRGLDKVVLNRSMEVTHLYNLGQDPYEMQNLARDGASWLLRDGLKALMKDWMRRVGDRMSGSGLRTR